MPKKFSMLILSIFCLSLFFSPSASSNSHKSETLILTDSLRKADLYPSIDLIKDRDFTISIDDASSPEMADIYENIFDAKQKKGFFPTGNWLKFDIDNQSTQENWLIEFAFPLIHELQFYSVNNESGQMELLYDSGANYPFHHREIEHRFFSHQLNIKQNEKKTYYAYAVGSGDLHPPIIIWNVDAFTKKVQNEMIMLGLFYGIISVMIIYNLFIFFSLRMKSYLYYVLTIIFTLLGIVSINGIGFQFLWPNYPNWNVIATPVWVSLSCAFILIFTKNFLNVDRYIPFFKKIYRPLIFLNLSTIIILFFSRYIALYMMVSFSIITFTTTLIVAIVCLKRGARQARFFVLGWVIFLTGNAITILERAVVFPFTSLIEHAGQIALTAEVVLLSLALADNIKIIREEKAAAELKAKQSKELALKNLQKADRLKDEFLAITSHELKTPLHGMIGIAESLSDGVSGPTSDDMKRQLSMIISSGKRLSSLVNEILDFSKLKYDHLELNIQPVHLNSVLNIVFAIIQPIIKEKPIQLIVNVDEESPIILADKNRLQQILYNLLDNAIKYTDEGTITISTAIQDDFLEVSIKDTGRGIALQDLNTIFEPFKQVENTAERNVAGIGIGLNITRRLIELHGGRLQVSSQIHKGSIFSFSLPIYQQTGEKVSHAIIEDIPTNEGVQLITQDDYQYTSGSKILVADDEIVNLQVLINHLSLEGYEVFTAPRGSDVFLIMENEDIDLVILDIMMPGMSGYEVCQRLREQYSLMELPILMLTAKDQLQDKVLAFNAGANDYLVKPCEKQELLTRVHTLLKMKSLNEDLMKMNIDLERKVSERTEKLKLTNDELKKSEHSRRQLLANIAHELGTPITIINNYIQSLHKRIIPIEDAHYRRLVFDKIKVLNRLIEDLYDLSILESDSHHISLEEVNAVNWLTKLDRSIALTVTESKRTFKSNVEQLSDEKVICKIDKERMDQLFSNLISNAIKHTKENEGQISIQYSFNQSEQLLIRVSDNGAGIGQDQLPFVFERFFKNYPTKEGNEGTGLGLAISKEIVENHHGKITVESEVGRGTTFLIVLPIQVRKDEMKYQV